MASEVFRSSPQLAAFLEFVGKAVLEGKAERIKSHTIGIEILRRPQDFDPQADPTVRIEATRLRRALDRYYSGPGQSDAVIISLPRGSYVPAFTRRAASLPVQDMTRPDRQKIRRGFWIAGGAILAVAVAGLLFNIVYRRGGDEIAGNWPTSAKQLLPGNGMPTLALQNFESIGPARANGLSAATLKEKIRLASARFETINILAGPEMSDMAVAYRLLGYVDYTGAGEARVQFSLLDVADGNVVWTQTLSQQPGEDRGTAENRMAGEVATMLLQPFGVIRARDYNRFLTGGKGDARYRCLLIASDAFRSFLPDAHERARDCLERLIAIDPGFGLGFSYLAGV